MIILIIIFLLTGMLSGLLAGLLGVGGGIIIVPVSYFILIKLGYSVKIVMHTSIATSLSIILFTSISSVFSHLKLGNVDKQVIQKWFFGIMTGSIIGAFFASKINGDILVLIFTSLAFLISINMFFQKRIKTFKKNIPNIFYINFLISSLIGFLSGIIGIGGGSFSVPILNFFSKKMHKAVGTSSVLGFFIALPGTISYIYLGWNVEGLPQYSLGYVNISILILVASTSTITANIGAKLSSKIHKDILKKIFAIFLLCTCISLVIEHFII